MNLFCQLRQNNVYRPTNTVKHQVGSEGSFTVTKETQMDPNEEIFQIQLYGNDVDSIYAIVK